MLRARAYRSNGQIKPDTLDVGSQRSLSILLWDTQCQQKSLVPEPTGVENWEWRWSSQGAALTLTCTFCFSSHNFIISSYLTSADPRHPYSFPCHLYWSHHQHCNFWYSRQLHSWHLFMVNTRLSIHVSIFYQYVW